MLGDGIDGLREGIDGAALQPEAPAVGAYERNIRLALLVRGDLAARDGGFERALDVADLP